MILDLILIFSTILAVLMAWKVNVQLNFYRFIVFLLFCITLLYTTPYFLTFIEESSVGFPVGIWYILGAAVLVLVFGGFWILVKKNTSSSTSFNRLFGSFIFGLIVFTSIVIIVLSLRDANVLRTHSSRLFDVLYLN